MAVTKEEAKYYQDKHILETKGHRLKENKATAVAIGIDPDNFDKILAEEKKKQEETELEKLEKDIPQLVTMYNQIKEVLRTFMDMSEENYTVIALWIMGTHCYNEFECYPLLFINATRGSGKTRLMKLLEQLVWKGKLQLNISESVMFRTKKDHTILLDELEQIGTKEQGTLREMMNASYKRGNKVARMQRKSTKDGEKWEVEEFDLYSPMAMANIWGMDETVLDRCISILLEKSSDKSRTQFMENYTNYTPLKHLNSALRSHMCSLCSLCSLKNNIEKWNEYIKNKYPTPPLTTHTTINTYTTLTTLTTLDIHLFDKISQINLQGRDLELYFPLFIIASILGENILNEILDIAKNLVDEKEEEEFAENLDLALCDFVSTKYPSFFDYVKITELVREFRVFLGTDEVEWLNNRWMGKSLNRLNLISKKRRMAGGMQVILNSAKAKAKLQKYKKYMG